ncbi:MAG: hypothetical protein A2Y60_04095, partial [Chloroflexi bacterium RBG_13_54_9]
FYDAGFAYLRFSYRGCGEGEDSSGGEFEDSTLTGRIQDYKVAIDFVVGTEVDVHRLGAMGSSLGGMVVLAAQDPRVKAMVTLATPCKLLIPTEEQLALYEKEEFFELPSGRRLRSGFLRDVRLYDICKATANIDCPILIIHGSNDDTVPVQDAHYLYESAKEPKRLVVIPGGTHSFDDPYHVEQLGSLAFDWFKQYL